MDLNSIDVQRQSQKIGELKTNENSIRNVVADDVVQPSAATLTVSKQLNENDKEMTTSPTAEALPKVLYLKKVSHPTLQLKATSTMNSSKEPIPKLIVSTKSIKLANQYDQLITPDGVRYIATARKPATPETGDNSTIKQADAIKSTKIIIKGITSQDKRLVVCESPTTDPLASPQLSPKLQLLTVVPIVESNKNESKESVQDESPIKMDERAQTPEPLVNFPDSNVDNRTASNSSTPRTNREMKQLQKTMKESKVLSDFVTLADATRRIKRKLNESEEIETILATTLDGTPNTVRSRSLSLTKESPDALISIRRNTRSLNAEFSAKQRKFLAGIQKHSRGDSDDDESDDDQVRGRRKVIRKSGKAFAPLKPGYDKYCWQCHQNDPQVACTHCKRTYHMECLKPKQIPKTENQKLTWECPECVLLESYAKDTEKAKYDISQLCTMLEFALKRLKLTSKTLVIPSESENIINSINFSTIEQKIANKEYLTTHSFVTDCRWILHNCTIFYSRNGKLLAIAKAVFKICKQEIYDIDTCHECYYNANTCKTDWFVEICTRPHMLVWAKLKGFPYWPAKAMTTNSLGMVDVRFFGDHDRAFVPIRDCYIYSEDHPSPITVKSKRQSIAHSIVEVDKYIKKLTAKFGSFIYPECKTFFDPFKEDEQLEKMIPNYRTYASSLQVNKKCTSKSDLTYKIVKTADNNLSIFKKNDKNILSTESIDEKATQHTERKHRKNSTNEPVDDLKYQVLKRDNDKSRVDGRVDSVILKRKAESPSPGESRKKMRLLTNNRRMSTPTVNSKNVVENVSNDQRMAIDEQSSKGEAEKRIDRKSSSKSRETPSKDVTSKPNFKEDLISAVVKKLDKLQAFVSTNDSKLRGPDPDTQLNKKQEICIDNTISNNIVDTPMTVIPQRKEPFNSNRTNATNLDKSKSDDENLLVPMHDRHTHEMNDSKKELRMPASTSSRQGSMSGSSIQSITGSLDDPFEISIKTEPMSGDERDNSIANEDSSERITSPFDNRSQNGAHETNFSKITVKNINTMTKPLEQMQRQNVAIRKIPMNKSVLRPDIIRQRARKSFVTMKKPCQPNITSSITSNIQHLQQQQNSQLKQSQNMVCIPMDRSNFQRIESIMLNNIRGTSTAHAKSNPPPLTAVSTTPTITVVQKDLMSQSKNNISPAVSTTISSVGPPPLSLTSPLTISEQSTNNNMIQSVQQPVPVSSDNLASVITDMMKHNEPKLTPKPIGPLKFEGTNQLTSEAGHYSKMLIDNSHKFADYFRSVFEVTLADIGSMGCSEARIQLLELELEQCKMTHAKELADLKSSTSMILSEMKKNFETEKTKMINETRRQCELDRIRAVEDTKKRQWCAHCGKEAKFYCCWNTSYCDYPCQQQHWPRHMTHCSQTDEFGGAKANSYGTKAKELTQLQSLSLRHVTNANVKKTTSTHVRPNQQLERVLTQSQPVKNNPTPKNQQVPASQFKVVNRLNPSIVSATSYISNTNVNFNSIGHVNSSE